MAHWPAEALFATLYRGKAGHNGKEQRPTICAHPSRNWNLRKRELQPCGGYGLLFLALPWRTTTSTELIIQLRNNPCHRFVGSQDMAGIQKIRSLTSLAVTSYWYNLLESAACLLAGYMIWGQPPRPMPNATETCVILRSFRRGGPSRRQALRCPSHTSASMRTLPACGGRRSAPMARQWQNCDYDKVCVPASPTRGLETSSLLPYKDNTTTRTHAPPPPKPLHAWRMGRLAKSIPCRAWACRHKTQVCAGTNPSEHCSLQVCLFGHTSNKHKAKRTR